MVARTDYTTARPPAPAPSRFAPALADAETALAEGRAADAERVAKAISALVRAVREVAEYEAFARANWLEDDDEALRAELRRRLALLVEADVADAPAEVLERILVTGNAR